MSSELRRLEVLQDADEMSSCNISIFVVFNIWLSENQQIFLVKLKLKKISLSL